MRLFIDRQKQSKDHNLINLSVSGDKTSNVLGRMEREARLRMRLNPPDDFTVLIAIGTNDSQIDKLNPVKNIDINEFENNIRKIIEIAERLSIEVILIGLVPVDETKTAPYKEQKYYLVEKLEEYNNVLQKISEEKQLRFVNFFPNWINMNLNELFDDGLHPNTEGHKIIFETIKNQLFSE